VSETRRMTLVMPVPPLELGVSWTGRSLLRWVVDNADDEMKLKLFQIRDACGGDSFRQLFDMKAAELNARVDARLIDPRGAPLTPYYTYLNDDGSVEVH